MYSRSRSSETIKTEWKEGCLGFLWLKFSKFFTTPVSIAWSHETGVWLALIWLDSLWNACMIPKVIFKQWVIFFVPWVFGIYKRGSSMYFAQFFETLKKCINCKSALETWQAKQPWEPISTMPVSCSHNSSIVKSSRIHNLST